MVKAIVFDFDGVIHNTFKFHAKKLYEYTDGIITEEVLKKAHEGNVLEGGFSKANLLGYADSIHNEIVKLKLDKKIRTELEIFNKLYDLFIITSAKERNVKGFLKNNDALNLFKGVYGAETSKLKTEKFEKIMKENNLNIDEIIFVTDTLGDILEANRIGIKTIAVDFGYHDAIVLSKGNPMCIISDFGDIKNQIKKFSPLFI